MYERERERERERSQKSQLALEMWLEGQGKLFVHVILEDEARSGFLHIKLRPLLSYLK